MPPIAGIALAVRALPDGEFHAGVLRAQTPTLAVAGVVILAVGAAVRLRSSSSRSSRWYWR